MKKLATIFLLLFIVVHCGYGQAGVEAEGKFVVILLDQLSLEEVNQYGGEEFVDLFNDSAQALMNVRTDQGINSDAIYQAFGAGNRGEKYGAIPGLLGQLLRENDKKIALFGNKDLKNEEGRQVMTIVMDNSGHLFFSDISHNILIEDKTFPGGMRTDYRKMIARFREGYKETDLIFLEIGDIARIKATDPDNGYALKTSLTRFDQLLGQVLASLDLERDQLMVVAPTPASEQVKKGARLSWVLMAGADHDIGMLVSPTTRRGGIVTISDLAPTILEYFQIDVPAEMMGRPMHSTTKIHGGLSKLLNLSQQVYRTSQLRSWAVKGFILFQIIIIVLAIITFLVRRSLSVIWWKIMINLFLGIMLVPLLFLFISPYWISGVTFYLVIFLGVLIMLTWLLQKYLKTASSQITIITGLTALLIIVDIFRGNPWMSSSLLGYCPIIGARYYGLGNEYMGILIGAAIIGWSGLLDLSRSLREKKLYLTPFFFGMVLAIIGFPALGANFGGAITASVGFTVTYLLLFKKEERFKPLLLICVVLVLFFAIIIIGDAYGLIGDRSHFGQTIKLVKNQGLNAIWTIVSRKISMNIKLLRWTIWTKVLLSFIVVLAILFKRPRGVINELTQQLPHFAYGFIGIITGSVITMFVNDSGVVAAATLLFFAIHPLIYLVLQKLK